MLSRPVLKEHLTVVPSEGGWLLHGGENELMRIRTDEVHRRVFGVVLPLLDGRNTMEEIERVVEENSLPKETAAGVIRQLARVGVLEDADASPLSPQEADAFRDQILYFGRFTGEQTGAALQAKLRAAVVDVVVTGRLGVCVAKQLHRVGIGRLRLLGESEAHLQETARVLEGERGSLPLSTPELVAVERATLPGPAAPDSLLVVTLDSWDPALLAEVNAQAITAGRPWLLVQAPGIREGTVGPLFVPGQTACYACLESRLLSHMSFHAEYQEFRSYLEARRATSSPWGGMEPHHQVLAGLATLEATKFLTGYATPTVLGAFVTVDWFALKMQQHHVLRVPRCLACRPPRVLAFPWDEAPVEPIEEEV